MSDSEEAGAGAGAGAGADGEHGTDGNDTGGVDEHKAAPVDIGAVEKKEEFVDEFEELVAKHAKPKLGMGAKDYEDGAWLLEDNGEITRKGKWRNIRGDVYDGEFKNGKYHGQGSVTYKNGDKYQGGWEAGRYHGFGVLALQEFSENGRPIIGRRYEGEWAAGKKHGEGRYVVGNGDHYHGGFKDDKPHGFGKYKYINGNVYKGEWVDGRWHGQGELKYKNGNFYKGSFYNGYLNGEGRFTYANGGGYYDGCFRSNLKHGHGYRLFASGNEYKGDYFNDHMQGNGKMTYTTGEYYLGQFKDDLFHGTGSYMYLTGDRYVGEFQRGNPTGRGRYEYAAGGYYDGEYMETVKASKAGIKEYLACNGKRHGRGVRVWKSGVRYEGEWAKNKMHGFGTMTGKIAGIQQRFEGQFEQGHRTGNGVCLYGNTDGLPFVCAIGHRHDGRSFCRYEGGWWMDVFHGHGVYKCCDGRSYDGEWFRGKRQGWGFAVLIPDLHRGENDRMFISGVSAAYRADRYDGEWEDDERQGEGNLMYPNGDTIHGTFLHGLLHGEAKAIFNSGREHGCIYKVGRLVRWLTEEEEETARQLEAIMAENERFRSQGRARRRSNVSQASAAGAKEQAARFMRMA